MTTTSPGPRRAAAAPIAPPPPDQRDVTLPEALTVKELAEILRLPPVEVIKKLMTNGVMASINQTIDFDTAAIVASDFGFEPHEDESEPAPSPELDELPKLDDNEGEDPASLQPRPPVVTILGHVDHGKTSLLDAVRKTNVTAGEAGGITQHIGAYQVETNKQKVTFLDTPGHAAFTAMRARGAQVTDIAVLVVAADDGVMPQTIEAINHVRAAQVPMIVAVNKVDLPDANPDRVKQQLTEHNVVVEDWGGEVPVVSVSAKTGEGLSDLLETIVLLSELEELKANPARAAAGVVVEAEMDNNRGPMATVLVKKGTLRAGDAVVVGDTFGKIKAMFDHTGARIREATPSAPASVLGLNAVPLAGDIFSVVSDEKTAREMTDARLRRKQAELDAAHPHVNLDTIYGEIKKGTVKELNIILKADVQGSVEAVRNALERLSNDEIRVKVIHSGTGTVTESDVLLAQASNGVIIGFQVRPEAGAKRQAEQNGVEIRYYEIIYKLIEDIEAALQGMLDPIYEERVDGHAEVRQIFKVSRLGNIAGCFVRDGTATRNSQVRVLRGQEVLWEGRLETLKRFQEDVREVAAGYECGIQLAGWDAFQVDDVIEFFHKERVR
jgi:translation initiation factor IF-2